jgi:hypothetical protein
VREFDSMPYWNPHLPGFDRISNEKAFIAGWTQLPLVETARDSWRWYRNSVSAQLQYPHKQYASEWGLSLERRRKSSPIGGHTYPAILSAAPLTDTR